MRLPFLWGFSFLHNLRRSSGTWDRSHHGPKEKKNNKKKIDLKTPKMRPDPPPRSNRRDIFNLDVFEVKRFLAVFAVERPLRALALVVALLLVEADVFFAGGAGDDHELALALVVELQRAERQWCGGLSEGRGREGS